MFSIHESGELLLLGFGEKGLRALTALFPWLTLLLAFGAILLLEWLLRYFKFGYRISMLRIFLTLTAIAITGSILINLTPLHARLLERADHDTLPVIGAIYEEIHDSHQQQGVFRGYVASTSAGSFTITHNDNDRDTDDGSWTIIPPVGFDIVSLSVGDRVYVAGKLQRDLVYAYGVKISQDRE